MIQTTLLMMGTGKQGGFEPLFLLGFVAIMYFFLMRPQFKKQKEQKVFSEGIKVGDKIVTIGGIHGKIVKENENGTLSLEGDRNTFFTIERSAISMEMTAAFNKRNTPVVAIAK
jgi:preprotein translocase subunit YajC